jgi:hypothetical protein
MDVFSTLSNGGGGSNEVASITKLTDEQITDLINNQGYIPISSIDDLEAISDQISGHSFSGAPERGITSVTTDAALSKNYVLINNIDFSDSPQNKSVIDAIFTGTFEGSGYELSHLTIHGTTTNIGLFKTISGATIQNLKISHFNISSTNSNVGLLAGGVRGVGNKIDSINIDVNSNVTGSRIVGGLVGSMNSGTNNSSSALVSNITNYGTVVASQTSNSANSNVGGIFGEIANHSIVTLSAITNHGDVSGVGYNIGGIIGRAIGANSNINLLNVSNQGDITGGTHVGGIIGQVENSIVTFSDITSQGNVSDTRSAFSFGIGGIIGLLSGGRISGGTITLIEPGINTAVQSSIRIGHIIGKIGTSATVNLFNINVNRPNNSLRLVGEDDSGHTITNNNDTLEIVNNASIIWIPSGFIPIASLEDLIAINSTNQHTFAGILMTEGGLSKSYVVIRDIDLTSGSGFTTSLINGVFTGTFDGNGYALSNLNITVNNDIPGNVGLFLEINGATVKNLTLQAFYISGRDTVGGLISRVIGNSNIVENIHVTDSVIEGSYYVGGLIGLVDNSQLTLSAILNSGNVMGGQSDRHDLGGIVGSIRSGSTVNISNTNNSGTVTGNYHLGGILGSIISSTVNISNTNNSGDLNAEMFDSGGIVGGVFNSTFEISYATNSGIVSGNADSLGGIIGKASTTTTITMTAINNEGDVTGKTAVGGIVGEINNITMEVSHTTNSGIIEGSNSTANVGGIIGVSTGTSNKLNISFTTNSGTVSAISTSNTARVGGIIGLASSGTVTGSNITLTGPGTTTAANSTERIGHMIGKIQNSPTTVNLTNIHINRPSNSLKIVGKDLLPPDSHTITNANAESGTFVDASITK